MCAKKRDYFKGKFIFRFSLFKHKFEYFDLFCGFQEIFFCIDQDFPSLEKTIQEKGVTKGTIKHPKKVGKY
jgi:hypothetical protein